MHTLTVFSPLIVQIIACSRRKSLEQTAEQSLALRLRETGTSCDLVGRPERDAAIGKARETRRLTFLLTTGARSTNGQKVRP